LLLARQQVAGGKTQRAAQCQAQTQQGLCARAVVGQLRPEHQPQPQQPHAAAGHHVGLDALPEKQPGIERVPQRGGGKHHGHQTAGNPLAGVEKTHEIQAEQAQPLRHADQVAATVHRLQTTAEQQHGEQDQCGQGKAVDDRHGNLDRAQLHLQGDPGGAPDEHGEGVEKQVHGTGPLASEQAPVLPCP